MANQKLNEVTTVPTASINNVKTFLAVMNDGSIQQMSKDDMATVLGELIDIKSQSSISGVTMSQGRWYRIAQSYSHLNNPISMVINIANMYGQSNQKHILVYVVMNGYGDKIVTKLASTNRKSISKFRIVSKDTTDTTYKSYLDILIANDAATNSYKYTSSNMIGVELVKGYDVTDEQIPEGYTSYEFDM